MLRISLRQDHTARATRNPSTSSSSDTHHLPPSPLRAQPEVTGALYPAGASVEPGPERAHSRPGAGRNPAAPASSSKTLKSAENATANFNLKQHEGFPEGHATSPGLAFGRVARAPPGQAGKGPKGAVLFALKIVKSSHRGVCSYESPQRQVWFAFAFEEFRRDNPQRVLPESCGGFERA